MGVAVARHRALHPLVPTVLFVLALVASMGLLAVATRTIPLGTAYAVWVGIGAVGTVAAGIVLRAEPVAPANLAALGLLVVADRRREAHVGALTAGAVRHAVTDCSRGGNTAETRAPYGPAPEPLPLRGSGRNSWIPAMLHGCWPRPHSCCS